MTTVEDLGGVPEEIRPNLYRVQVPLPNNPLRFLNSYFILSADKTTIIDVGFDHPDCQAALEAALARFGRSWDSVEIVLTHSHPDHTGCLDRIWKPGMTVYANMHSFQEVANLMAMQATVVDPVVNELVRSDDHTAGNFVSGRDGSRGFLQSELLPLKKRPAFEFLDDGDEYRTDDYTFQVLATPGHDAWHICLYEPDEKLLVAGDTVLERITPSVGSWLVSWNALQEFLDSLRRLHKLDARLALPGHGRPFSTVADRTDFLIGHHRARLAEIEEVVRSGNDNIIDIARACTWKHPDWDAWAVDQKFFSLSETMAHLIYLVNDGKVRYTVCGTDMRFLPEG